MAIFATAIALLARRIATVIALLAPRIAILYINKPKRAKFSDKCNL
jgi:hypothetical protein